MAYYKTCPDCGAALDPGEKCDCQSEKEREQELFRHCLKKEPGVGQLTFVFDGLRAIHKNTNCC